MSVTYCTGPRECFTPMPTDTSPLLSPSGETNQLGGCLRENWPALDWYETQLAVGSGEGVGLRVADTLGDGEATALVPAPTLPQAIKDTTRSANPAAPFTR